MVKKNLKFSLKFFKHKILKNKTKFQGQRQQLDCLVALPFFSSPNHSSRALPFCFHHCDAAPRSAAAGGFIVVVVSQQLGQRRLPLPVGVPEQLLLLLLLACRALSGHEKQTGKNHIKRCGEGREKGQAREMRRGNDEKGNSQKLSGGAATESGPSKNQRKRPWFIN